MTQVRRTTKFVWRKTAKAFIAWSSVFKRLGLRMVGIDENSHVSLQNARRAA